MPRGMREDDSPLTVRLEHWLNDGGLDRLLKMSAHDIAQFAERIRIADGGTPAEQREDR